MVSSDTYNQLSLDLIVAQITGNINAPPRFGDHRIGNWQHAGLRAPSIVRAKLATLDSRLVTNVLGRLPASDMQAVESNLRAALQV